jgi:pyridoxine 4-dehydrogenase
MSTQTIELGGVTVRRIGLGTNRLTMNDDTIAFIRRAVGAGLQHIDTAHLYTSGASEQAIGAALDPKPDDCVVATKGGYEPGTGPDALRAEIEESLRRLRTETIDLYYLHRVHEGVPLEQSLSVIAEYRDAGRIRNVGISEVTIEQIERARAVVPITAVQNRYNLGDRGHDDVVDHCAAEGIVFVPYYPLKSLGGGVGEEIAGRHGATPGQIALAWLLHRSPVMLPIPGTLSPAHLRENLAALEIELADDEFEALAGA